MKSSKKITFDKGMGCQVQLAQKGWNILDEDVSFPIATLNEKILESNAKWMQSFIQQSGVELAPHGKTTMAPELFNMQIEHGAWGMSLATVPQVITAYQHGIKRVILANQLIGAYHFQLISELLEQDDFSFYCFVDSIENAHALGQYFTERKVAINILIEIGVAQGRCGWRDLSTLPELLDVINLYDGLQLSGLSFYEGVIHGDDASKKVSHFVEGVVDLAVELNEKNIFDTDDVIITGAGSAWYDIVAEQLQKLRKQNICFQAILRPGCYLIHDTGIYHDAQQDLLARSQLACDISGELISSLELWAYVQSVPESGLAIIGLGKRDAAFDAGLPTPQQIYRPHEMQNTKPEPVDSQWQVINIMDQHCMMTFPENAALKPGDLMCFSTSHPCLTIDKWRHIGIVNDDYLVTKTIATYF